MGAGKGALSGYGRGEKREGGVGRGGGSLEVLSKINECDVHGKYSVGSGREGRRRGEEKEVDQRKIEEEEREGEDEGSGGGSCGGAGNDEGVSDDASSEVQSVDSEDLLNEQMYARRKTTTMAKKELKRADSMKDLGQTLRDDLGVKVHGLREDGNVSSYEVRPETEALLLGALRLKSVNLDTLFQLSHCSLREISLAANIYEEIDLNAVSHCPNLEVSVRVSPLTRTL